MFKRKPIYIILLIVFTLLLCADVLAAVLTANTSSGGPSMPSNMQSGETEGGRGGFGGNASDTAGGRFGGGNGASVATDSALPETTDGGNAFGAENEGFDPEQMQGDANMPDRMRAAAVSGLASFISGWWIPIGVLCVLVDAFSVFMLIRINKKSGITADPDEEPAEQEKAIESKPMLSSYEKRRKKRRRTIRIFIIILAVIVAIVLGYVIVRSIYLTQLEQEEAVSVVSARAAGAKIDTVISGTGTLSDEDAQDITVPNEVEIKAYHIKNGDTVKAGDVLATVDHTSVMKAIEDLQGAMDSLGNQIEEASTDTIQSKIRASVEGRVKAIYAKEGTGVSDTMYDSGALMLISLDGLMAADIETDAGLVTGDSVVVFLADGTEKAGRVDSVSGGTATITVTDNGTVFGEEVTVTDEDGNTLGTGALYIHSELKVTGYSGTVASINCTPNDTISSGDTLLTLTDTAYTAEHKLLLATRNKYEQEMIKLFKLYQDGNLYAEFAGTVSGVDEENATGSALASDTAGSDTLASKMLTSNALAFRTATSFTFLGTASSATIPLGNNPSGTDDTTVQEYSNFVASVSSISYSSLALMEYPTSVSITDYSAFNSLGVTSEMMTTQTKIGPPANTPVYMFENGAWTSLSVSDISAGDILILTYGAGGATSDPVWIIIASQAEKSQGGSTPSYSGGSSGTSTGSQTDTQQTEELYTVSETTAMSVTPSDTMNVTITIDELDILSMEVGQEATITLDAISGQTFTGSVTQINTKGTNSGGSTKFTAVVTLDKTEKMLAGMNAAVSITLSSTECAVTVPVAALVETESGVLVYTSYDEEKELFGDPVNVKSGLSDGANAEILSGISSGDEIWYAYDDTISISSSVVSSSSGGGFNLMRIFRGR